MASTTSYEVHLGFWTNWSHGKIQGATFTLTRQHGGFLIAFLAIFIGMVGKSFWRLGCFALHRYFSSAEAQDGLYHQRQAILRNSDTAQDGAWRLLMSMLAWRSGQRARHPISRLLPIIVAAFTISSAFGIASIFSSNVTSETLNQVLLKGERCGSYNTSKPNSVYKQLTLLLPHQAEKATKFLNYGMQCYTNESHTDGCNLYIKPRLPLQSTRGVACPFSDNICKLDNDNLVMDTGLLDSLDDFGVNTAPENRFQFRMVYTCAPLKTQGYTRDYNDSDYGAVKRYMYGTVENVRQVINWTYEAPIDNAYLPGDGTSSANIPRLEYQLGIEKHYATPNETLLPGVNEWSPIVPLLLNDADVHLLFMSAPELHYATPVDDPWFSAHKNASELNDQDTKKTFSAWLQDEPVSPLACTQQVQYCNPNLPADERCEPLRGVIDPRKSSEVKKIFRTDDQFATIKWVDDLWTFGVYTISATVGFVGASALRARYGLSYGYSAPLPDNQWQLEAEHWIKATLASLQDVFVEAANGIPASLEDFRQPPLAADTVAQNMCVNQKIVSDNFSSFNVLGLALILVLGAAIIGLDIAMEPAVVWFQRRKYRQHHMRDACYHDETTKHPLYAALEWSQTGVLQLQRLAQEEAGYAEWSNCDRDVPVTQKGQVLAALDVRQVEHPMLKREGEKRGEESGVMLMPWELRRSDTGMETLVGDGMVGKEGRKEVRDLPPDIHAIRQHDDIGKVDVQEDEKQAPSERSQDWRAFR